MIQTPFFLYYGTMIGKRTLLAIVGLLFASFFVVSQDGPDVAVYPPQAIIIASYRGDDLMVSQILSTNVDKDARDALGATALHAAMYQPNLKVVKLLLDYGFDPNARDTAHGYTPLHLAVIANNPAAAQLLMQYKADTGIKGLDGLTPLAKAREGEKKAMVSVLTR